MSSDQLICVSSTEHDIEVWGTVTRSESGGVWHPSLNVYLDTLKAEADRLGVKLHACHIETWPQVREDYRRRFGWPSK